MPFLQLPYELIVQVSSSLRIADLLNLAITCTYVHTCLDNQLKVHQHKLATLSSIDDRNRPRTMSALRMLFEHDSPEHDDTWYFREVVAHAYSNVLFRRMSVDANMPNLSLSDIEPFNTTSVISQMNLLSSAELRSHDRLLRSVDYSEGFEGFLTLALMQMPRLSRLRFALHPCNGNHFVRWRYIENAVAVEPARVQVLGLFMALLSSFESRLINEPTNSSILLPGLKSVQSIEIEIDELHSFNNFGQHGALRPEIHTDSIRPLFLLPNLRKLLLSRHPLARLKDSIQTPIWEVRTVSWRHLYRKSPIEELILMGFGACLQSVQLMTRSIEHLRTLILQQRGNENHIKDVISILQLEHASSLETFVPPHHTSNALSWCQCFSRLKYLTVSYVEIMNVFQEHQNQLATSDGECDIPSIFQLATRIPETLEMIVFIGGLVSCSITSLMSFPLCSDTQDIESFIKIVTMLVSTRGSTHQFINVEQTFRCLRDLCFGDMRVAYRPENAAEGARLHMESTQESEAARSGLGKALQESEELKEVCSSNGVQLHFTDTATRVCDHVDRHPYPQKKRLTREELVAEAKKLSEDADVITKTVLSRYVDNIPVDYRP